MNVHCARRTCHLHRPSLSEPSTPVLEMKTQNSQHLRVARYVSCVGVVPELGSDAKTVKVCGMSASFEHEWSTHN